MSRLDGDGLGWLTRLSSRSRAPEGRGVAAIAACAPLGRWGVRSLSFRRLRPWRKRQDSVPVSMMCVVGESGQRRPWAIRASGNTLVHSPNGRLVVTISEAAFV